jgi:hypothetical protein
VRYFYAKQLTLCGYHLLEDVAVQPPAADLGYLADLVGRRVLTVHHEPAAPWTLAADVLRSLETRSVNGKAIMTVEPAVR